MAVIHLQLPDRTLACGAEHTPYHTGELLGAVVVVTTHEICCVRSGRVTCPDCKAVAELKAAAA